MGKLVCLILALLLTYSSLLAQKNELQIAPVNTELVKYVKMLKRGYLKKTTTTDHALGYIPHSIKFVVKTPESLKKTTALPDSFDLRNEGKLTTVKNQSTCGACWTFASYGSIESRWLVLGSGSYDLSEQNLKNGSGFEIEHCDGGNASIATAYLTRGDGPVLEADDPYDVDNSDYVSGLTPRGYIPNARFLSNDADVLKQILYDYGAVYTNMFWENSYYNAANFTYHYNLSADSSSNHAVLLVGWNDHLQTDGGTGAWIIRNSWGPAWGDSGFFYISYNDIKVNSNPAYWPNRLDYDENFSIHQYDTLGSIGALGYSEALAHGLVKFVMAENQQITKVGTWINNSNSTVSFDIYDNFNGSTLSGHLASIGDQTCNYPGYYTFNLPSAIELDSGNDIYIKVKYNVPGEDYPVPVETYVDGYANPKFVSGKCWLSYNGGTGTWDAIGAGTGFDYDLCVKAYGIAEVTSIENDGNLNKPKTFMLQNYPNPFNPSTVINYQLQVAGEIELTVYDVLGKKIRTLSTGFQKAGQHKVVFDAKDLSNGIYFYKLISRDYVQVRKMILIK